MRKQYFETLIDIYALPIRVSFHLGMLGMHVFNSNYNSVQPAENPEKKKILSSNAPHKYFASLNYRIFCKKFASLI